VINRKGQVKKTKRGIKKMRIKIYTAVLTLFLASMASAESIEIPLFEDTLPNLGRQGKPQDKIVLTPSQLPEVHIDLDNNVRPVVKNKEPEEIKTNVNEIRPVSKPIALSTRFSSKKSEEMSQQLNLEIQSYQESKARQEFEKAKNEADKNKKIQEMEKSQVIESIVLEDLFGQMKDVRSFDVSGIELGMTPDEVLEVAQERGYELTKVEHGIPLHLTSFYKERCNPRMRDIEKKNCIIDQAKTDEVYYISSMTMKRPQTAEYMQVLFSTLATDNVSYKIYYENKGDNSLNYTRKNLAKKVRRRDAFWNMMYETYGQPDDAENMIWGNPQEAYMQAMMQGSAYNAYIVLENKAISDEDYVAATEQAKELRYKHSFTFGEVSDDED
jgi:hypothetical protein